MQFRRTAVFVTRVASAVLFLPVAAAAQLAPTAPQLQLSQDAVVVAPGVVLAPARQHVYVMAPNDAVSALDLTSGTQLWSSTAAAMPLGLHGNLLAAQALGAPDTLQVVLLDVLQNGATAARVPLAMPDGVRAVIDDQLGHHFEASFSTRSGSPELDWLHRATTRGGARLAATAPPATDVTNRHTLDLGVLRFGPSIAPAPPAPLPAAATAFAQSARVSTPPRVSGAVVAATEVAPGRQGITLKRWDPTTGTALPDVQLTNAPFILDLPAADGRTLLVTERTGAGPTEYTWRLFALETGTELGSFETARSNGPFAVIGSTLVRRIDAHGQLSQDQLVHTPPTVEVRDLGSGAVLWQTEIRDTRFYGEVPP